MASGVFSAPFGELRGSGPADEDLQRVLAEERKALRTFITCNERASSLASEMAGVSKSMATEIAQLQIENQHLRAVIKMVADLDSLGSGESPQKGRANTEDADTPTKMPVWQQDISSVRSVESSPSVADLDSPGSRESPQKGRAETVDVDSLTRVPVWQQDLSPVRSGRGVSQQEGASPTRSVQQQVQTRSAEAVSPAGLGEMALQQDVSPARSGGEMPQQQGASPARGSQQQGRATLDANSPAGASLPQLAPQAKDGSTLPAMLGTMGEESGGDALQLELQRRRVDAVSPGTAFSSLPISTSPLRPAPQATEDSTLPAIAEKVSDGDALPWEGHGKSGRWRRAPMGEAVSPTGTLPTSTSSPEPEPQAGSRSRSRSLPSSTSSPAEEDFTRATSRFYGSIVHRDELRLEIVHEPEVQLPPKLPIWHAPPPERAEQWHAPKSPSGSPSERQHLSDYRDLFPLRHNKDKPKKVSRKDRLDFLSRVELFKELPQDLLSLISAVCEEVTFAKGEVLFWQGDDGHEFFYDCQWKCQCFDRWERSEHPQHK